MKVNGHRIRADFVAMDGNGKLHVFEVKHGSGRLTQNQTLAGVFNMNNPSNTNTRLGGETITPSSGTQGSFTLATRNKKIIENFEVALDTQGIKRGGTFDVTFGLLKYQ